MPVEKFEAEFYDEIWKKVDSWKFQGGAYRRKDSDSETISFLKNLKRKYKMLDVGCGGGRDSITFSKAGHKVTGIDFAPEAIELAKKLANENKLKINFQVDDILESKLSEKFDLVFDVGCLHHLRKKHWKKYINSLKKLTSKNALLRIVTLSANSQKVGSYRFGMRTYFLKNGHYTKLFSKDELKKFFSSFKIVSILEFKKGKSKAFWEVILEKN